jgi:hypothetical protein
VITQAPECDPMMLAGETFAVRKAELNLLCKDFPADTSRGTLVSG